MTNFPINPIGELLVVKLDESNSTVKLPDWKRTLCGTVLATGPTVRDVEKGQRVLFGAAVGMDSVFSGQEVRILKEQDLDLVYEA